MAYLEVLEAGLMTSLQDLGRFGHQAQGVPVSGALDPVHLRLANALVGNDAGQGALEMRMLGPKFRLEAESARLALCGTGGHIELLGPEIGIIAANRSVTVRRGQFFRVNAISDSGSSVLAVEGGFDVPALYGSQSTYMLGGFGGFEGRRLAAGDHVPLSLMRIDARPEQILLDPPVFAKDAPVRVVLGPQDNYFSAEGVETFLSQPYTISAEADRMGMRLNGPAISHAKGFNINSDGIVTGSIQVPGNGRPILLLADHQTTGGYPKIATVASVDLPRLGRMKPGDVMRFAAISVAEAEKARRDQERQIEVAIAAMRPLPGEGGMMDYLLAHHNLISGVAGDDASDAHTY